MCGINGIFAYAGGRADHGELRRTAAAQAARGPDGSGEWISGDGRLALAHRRLAVIDLSDDGLQPMTAAGGRVTLVFNGEIYNHVDLRRDLEARGHAFRSRSDTEVIAALYDADGPEMVNRLRGMFAFALYDHARRRLVMARDPYGIKPLYYADDGRCVRFASTVKGLTAGGSIPSAPSAAGLVGFAILGSVPEPFTAVRAVNALPAGSLMIVDDNGPGAPLRWFSLAQSLAEAEAARAPEAAAVPGLVREALLDSVRAHLVADVPVGLFLSAGVDSGALAGLMVDAGASDFTAVTLSFEDFHGTARDEAPLATAVARQYGARHVVRRVGRAEFAADLPRIFAAMDQPTVDGINTWFVAKATREAGLKVALSGVGGDELTGGYDTFLRLPRLLRRARPFARLPLASGLFRRLGRILVAAGAPLPPKAPGVLTWAGAPAGAWLLLRATYLPEDVREAFADPAFVADGLATLKPATLVDDALDPCPATDFGRVAALESGLYLRNQLLRDADWAGMAHGLEIRTPLVDATLLRRLAPVFAREAPPAGKPLLAGAPTRPLPPEIVSRRKTGFGIPLRAWTGDDQPERGFSRRWARRVLAEWMG